MDSCNNARQKDDAELYAHHQYHDPYIDQDNADQLSSTAAGLYDHEDSTFDKDDDDAVLSPDDDDDECNHALFSSIQAPRDETARPSPELTASLSSLCSWSWLSPLIALGNRRILQAKDLYDLNPHETTEHCEKLLKDTIERASKDNITPPIWIILWHCYGVEFCRIGISRVIWLIATILQVYILKSLVKIVANGHNMKWWWGVLLIVGMFVVLYIPSLALHKCLELSQKVGMKIRSTVCMIVFNKLLSLKLVTLTGANSGLLLNLVTNDSQKLLDAATFFHPAWSSVLDLITIGTLAIIEVGVSAIPGVILTLLILPLQVWMARKVGKARVKAVKYTDARVHLTREALNGIRVIKFNGWIVPFLQRISELRKQELRWIRRAAFVRASNSTIRDSITPLATLATFGTYFALHGGQFLPPEKAFTILALFGIFVRTFSFAATGIQITGEAVVSLRRLQKLLDLNDAEVPGIQDDCEEDHLAKAAMALNCSFSWDKNNFGKFPKVYSKKDNFQEFQTAQPLPTQTVLQEINLILEKGELISIHGSVGSGKSSLLYSLLGELQCLKGKYFIQRNVAYVPQQPWILNDTIRRNIILTNPFDFKRYQRVISACALEHDILQFKGGHEAEIGDRGINLSGGQKARISLARACYSKAPVLLLDDPLAAVDVPTAKHLIKHVLKGILKGRSVVLVTHNRTVLDLCDHCYKMENGNLFAISDMDLYGSSNKKKGLVDHGAVRRDNESIINGSEQYIQVNPDTIECADSSENGRPTKIEKVVEIIQEKEMPTENTLKGTTQITEAEGKTTVEEDRVEGNIQLSTWINYVKASGGFPLVSCVILVFIIGQSARVMVDYWLRVWTDGRYDLKAEVYLAVYAGLAAGAIILSLIRALLFTIVAMIAAGQMHFQMAERVLRSPQLFFDQNVTGRILNRLSKDQAIADEMLPNSLQMFLEYTVLTLGNFVLIGALVPWFLLAIPACTCVAIYFQKQYAAVSCELKRIEGLTRSPMYAHFSQTLQGIVSIRAYGVQTTMRDIFVSLIDTNHRPYILFVHLARWLAVRLDFATIVCITLVSIIVVVLRNTISQGLAGIILVESLQLGGFIQFAVRQSAEVETYFTSVERIQTYCKLKTEADPSTAPGVIDRKWPSNGEIEFKKYKMTYREDLPPVLDGISFKVNAREKIGILGRTGVGKSSLAAALFRMVENPKCTGDILIDQINIKLVGLDDLRKHLSIISQDPILFEGSLRFNIDPFELYSDAEINEVLSRVHLKIKIQSLESGLDSLIAQNGENFSVGQRQLICLARSLLRRSQIIVMDEATAAVDGETDGHIQATIRTALHDCTVLTIAHRIDTVIDCNRVLVLIAGGHIGEYDSPCNLLDHQENGGTSIFAEMVHQTGPAMSKQLHEAARAAERSRKDQGSKAHLTSTYFSSN